METSRQSPKLRDRAVISKVVGLRDSVASILGGGPFWGRYSCVHVYTSKPSQTNSHPGRIVAPCTKQFVIVANTIVAGTIVRVASTKWSARGHHPPCSYELQYVVTIDWCFNVTRQVWISILFQFEGLCSWKVYQIRWQNCRINEEACFILVIFDDDVWSVCLDCSVCIYWKIPTYRGIISFYHWCSYILIPFASVWCVLMLAEIFYCQYYPSVLCLFLYSFRVSAEHPGTWWAIVSSYWSQNWHFGSAPFFTIFDW